MACCATCRKGGDWSLTPAECLRSFVGKAVKDEAGRIEAQTGQLVTEDWRQGVRERRNAKLSRADRFKLALQRAPSGRRPYLNGLIFNGHEMPPSKPFPDWGLAASGASVAVSHMGELCKRL